MQHAGTPLIIEDDHFDYERNWKDTKFAFNRALRSPENFNAFHWVVRLFRAALCYLYYKSGLESLGIHRYWRSSIPCCALSLVSLVLLSYFTRLRQVIVERWCCPLEANHSSCMDSCRWPILHDCAVCYIGLIILFNYVSACFRSPGVALSSSYQNVGNDIPEHLQWKAIHCQGGCSGFDPSLDIKAERQRLIDCNKMKQESKKSSTFETFPSNEWTFCKKCNVHRPPRTHHCSTCKRCIIGFDHHCVWVNNCIGYNNYRQFILLLFYICLGCWYGSFLLIYPFYMPLKKQVDEHGFRFLYSNNTGFLNIPPPWTMLRSLFSNNLETEVIVKLVFPLLFSVGAILTIFFSYHVMYVISGLTTLEHRILVEKRLEHFQQRREAFKAPPNPFDHGFYRNLHLVLGPNLFLIFLPIPVEPSLNLLPKKAHSKNE